MLLIVHKIKKINCTFHTGTMDKLEGGEEKT